MAYTKKTVPLCNSCGRQHYNWTVCDARRREREAAAAAASVEGQRLARNQNTLPPVETHGQSGMRPWGDRLHTVTNTGGVLSQIRPPRPGAVRVPDDWKED